MKDMFEDTLQDVDINQSNHYCGKGLVKADRKHDTIRLIQKLSNINKKY